MQKSLFHAFDLSDVFYATRFLSCDLTQQSDHIHSAICFLVSPLEPSFRGHKRLDPHPTQSATPSP